MFFCIAPVSAQVQGGEPGTHKDGGLAILAGLGPIGPGFQFEHQIYIKDTVRLTPFAGIGISAGGPDSSASIVNLWLSNSAGVNLEYGKKQRLVAGPFCYLANNIYNNPSDAKPGKTFLIGPAFSAGYQFSAAKGFIFQMQGGAVYLQNPLLVTDDFFISPLVSLYMGYLF